MKYINDNKIRILKPVSEKKEDDILKATVVALKSTWQSDYKLLYEHLARKDFDSIVSMMKIVKIFCVKLGIEEGHKICLEMIQQGTVKNKNYDFSNAAKGLTCILNSAIREVEIEKNKTNFR